MPRYYQDFEPDCRYIEGEAHDIIELQVKDFRTDQLKVYFGSNRVVTISGERPLHGTTTTSTSTSTSTWIRFRKEFNTPDCKSNEIRAKLKSGILYITLPKKSDISCGIDVGSYQQISRQEKDPLTQLQQPTSSSTSIQDSSSTQREEDEGNLKQDSSSTQSEEDEGNLKQDSSSTQSEEDDDDEVLPDEQPSPAGAKYFVSRFKVGRKTALQVVAGVAVLFSYILFCIVLCRNMMHV